MSPPHREVLRTWAAAIGLIALAKAVSALEPTGLLAANLAGIAALAFILLPEPRLRARGEGWGDLGLAWWGAADRRTWRAWGLGALQAAAVAAVAFPLFALCFGAFAGALPALPPGLRGLLAPYGPPGPFRPRLPPGFALQALLQLLVVALPEELFYRGYVQTTLRRALPGRGAVVLGARLGPGFLATQLLFAAGHLVSLQPWRLGTFLPGLLFGWLRERTGGLAAPIVLHALSNLFLRLLEAGWYGS